MVAQLSEYTESLVSLMNSIKKLKRVINANFPQTLSIPPQKIEQEGTPSTHS